ncbi:MAG: type I-E CRISPR-associated protein Cas7/Cse4/CasC [bacterium]|nr:type I-E CRISPR-associated protein Cas7/Cse4/CasC [bacterium]
MLIEIHAIQNHSPANLNRDDLGAPKTCYFGGVLRSRISSQCLKRSIRLSKEFENLLGGVRTRRLAEEIDKRITAANPNKKMKDRIENILDKCGIKPKTSSSKKAKKNVDGEVNDDNDDDSGTDSDPAKSSKMLVYTTQEAIDKMAELLLKNEKKDNKTLAEEFARLIAELTVAPDMALYGRMLEPSKNAKIWEKLDRENLNTQVEAALQVAHAISTHEARLEIDYYVAADDIPGEDAGAGYLDEAMFTSACFYKYFSINWETLLANLKGNKKLAAHTVGAFIKAAALVNPTGKQNSFAAHNPPSCLVIELKKKNTPVNYANAFAKPVNQDDDRDLIWQSIAQLITYINDIDQGYGRPDWRLWFSPNGRYSPKNIDNGLKATAAANVAVDSATANVAIDSATANVAVDSAAANVAANVAVNVAVDSDVTSLDETLSSLIKKLGQEINHPDLTWEEVQKEVLNIGSIVTIRNRRG